MTLQLAPENAALVARLAPYARYALVRAAREAERLHANELAPEHLLTAILADESAGATRLVLHAFADPETIADEVLALSPGIMVVGSERTVPFSGRSLVALRQARDQGALRVLPRHVLEAALPLLDAELAAALAALGLAREGPASAPAASLVATPAAKDEEPLFRAFSNDAKRALGVSARVARELGRDEISPAHLVIACLEIDAGLAGATRLTAQRARLIARGRDADDTPPAARALDASRELLELLSALEPGADTYAVLGWFLHHGSEELRQLLLRQKVTPALFAHAHGAFEDPEPPVEPD